MSIGPFTDLSIRLEHRHGDGSWGTFERAHHDPAEHDPERDWAKGQLYACTSCPELVRIGSATQGSASRSDAAERE